MQTILIIDDDAAIGNLEQEILERAGYAVLRAYSGTEALLLLKSSRPDFILLDLTAGAERRGSPAAAPGHSGHRGQRQNRRAGQSGAAPRRRGGLPYQAIRHKGAVSPRGGTPA